MLKKHVQYAAYHCVQSGSVKSDVQQLGKVYDVEYCAHEWKK